MPQGNLIDNKDGLMNALSGKAPAPAPEVTKPIEQEQHQEQEQQEQEHIEQKPIEQQQEQHQEQEQQEVVPKTIEDYNKMVSEKFGLESVEALFSSDAADKYKGFDGLKSKVSDYEKEIPALYEEFNKSANPFASEFTFKLNHLQTQHPDLDPKIAVALVGTDLKEMTSTDALLMEKRISNPEFSEAQTRTLLAMEYGFDSWDELKENDDANKTLLMDAKASKAKKELSKYNVSDVEFDKDKSILPESIREKIVAQQAAHEEAVSKIDETWSPFTKDLEARIEEFPIAMETKDKGVETYSNIKLSADDKKILTDNVKDYIKNIKGYTELNKENSQDVQRFLNNMIILSKYPSMVKIAVDKAVSDTKMAIEKERFNPSGSGSGNGGGTKPPVGKTGARNLAQIINEKAPTRKAWEVYKRP